MTLKIQKTLTEGNRSYGTAWPWLPYPQQSTIGLQKGDVNFGDLKLVIGGDLGERRRMGREKEKRGAFSRPPAGVGPTLLSIRNCQPRGGTSPVQLSPDAQERSIREQRGHAVQLRHRVTLRALRFRLEMAHKQVILTLDDFRPPCATPRRLHPDRRDPVSFQETLRRRADATLDTETVIRIHDDLLGHHSPPRNYPT